MTCKVFPVRKFIEKPCELIGIYRIFREFRALEPDGWKRVRRARKSRPVRGGRSRSSPVGGRAPVSLFRMTRVHLKISFSLLAGSHSRPAGPGSPERRARYRNPRSRGVRQMRAVAREAAANRGEREGVLKKPSSLGIDHRRHSGENRNPFLRLLPFVRVPAHRREMKRRRVFTRIRKWIPSNPPALVGSDTGMTNKTASLHPE